MKKNGLKRKAALTLAVLGTVSPIGSVGTLLNEVSMIGVNRAEAWSDEDARHESEMYEYIMRLHRNDATNNANNTNKDLNNITDAGKNVIKSTVSGDITAAENRAKADATTKADNAKTAAINAAAADATTKSQQAESNAKSYTDEVAKTKANTSLNNINNAGKEVIRELAKAEMKDTGVNTEGTTVIIEKTTEIKDGLDIDGPIHSKGDVEIDGKTTLHGDTVIEGNSVVEGDATIKGSTALGGDKATDILEVNAKTNIHGDTTIGDGAFDKFTVNATSEFKSDATFDKNVLVKGDQTVDGNNTVHGNQNVDGDSHVKGNIEVDKDMSVHGAMIVDGDIEVSDDLGTKGNMTVGKTLTVGDNATFKKDVYVEGVTNTGALVSRGDAIIGGDAHIYGDTVLDGTFFTKGAATFESTVDIAKDLTVGGNAHVVGDSVVDGDSYARSYNIGKEKYIDKDGVNANGHKIRNVADGEIGPNSLDAVNGRQLWHTREALQHNVNQVGAATAAMASLHPLEFEHDDKFSVSAAVGNYKDQTAMAAGVYYRPNIKSLISLSGTMGNSDNMLGVGYSAKFGKVSEFGNMTEDQLRDKVSELNDSNKALKADNEALKAKDVSQENQIAALSAKNADLEKSLSDITKAYSQLMFKVDSMAAELANLKATQK